MNDVQKTRVTPEPPPAESVEAEIVTGLSASVHAQAGGWAHPVRAGLSACTSQAGADIAASVQRIRSMHDEAMEYLKHFAERVVTCGMELLQLKQAVGYGRWARFCKEHVYTERFGERHMQRYMQIATAIRPKVRALTDGGESITTDPAMLRDALADATNATSWRQLWLDLGLLRQHKPVGGDHGGGAARASLKQTRMELERLQAGECWVQIVQRLRQFADRGWKVHVHPQELRAGLTSIKECLRKIGE